MRSWLAQWYRRLWPASPADVRAMTPSEVASVLGLDEQATVRAVPWTGDAPRTPPMIPATNERRVLRKVE